MTITPDRPSLAQFAEAAARAAQGEGLTVVRDGETLALKAVGRLPGQREVTRVRTDATQPPDTVRVFLEQLQASFGGGITTSVARELSLDCAPGKPLEARAVARAIDMANTAQTAFSGVNFLSRMVFSARAPGRQFEAVSASLGVPADRLTAEQRGAIDAAFGRAFAAAASGDTTVVDFDRAADLLRTAIAEVLGLASPPADRPTRA